MIDILRQKVYFPLKNFDDVEKLFRFNLDKENGEPNLALLSIVAGLVEHSLVTITDKDDLIANSRPIEHKKDISERKFNLNRTENLSASSSSQNSNTNYHLSSTSNDNIKEHQQKSAGRARTDYNEACFLSSNNSNCSSPDLSANDNLDIPEIEFEIVETLYKRFADQFKSSVDLKDSDAQKTNMKIKKISDSVWEHLSNSYYKDKAHLQSIYSYLTTSKLDCFGLAFAVIAGCQILNLKNIYLALSEDHAWVMFDLKPEEFKAQKEREAKDYIENNLPVPTCALHGTCEVTWHGKANSDKRGQPVTYKNCWLYTNGYAVKCDIRLCVAALVSSINPSINTNTESEILALLQQRLLWLLFEQKNYFPMSLGNLGELENICPTSNAPLTPHELFNLGIEISRTEYNDSHVYPYSYLASFFFNAGRFKEALETWADASSVMTKYNYSRDDEEIYKEFFEVANELIPSMLKVLTAGGLEPGRVSQKPFLQDPECLALILKFYDNICCWEEGSSTPVLHTGWAKNFVATLLKFSPIIRSKIKLLTEEEWNHNKACASEREVSSHADQCSSTENDTANNSISLHIINHHKNQPTKHESNEIQSHERRGRIKEEPEEEERMDSDSDEIDRQTFNHNGKKEMRKRAHSDARKAGVREKMIKLDKKESSVASGDEKNGHADIEMNKNGVGVAGRKPREKRLEIDSDNNVTVILKSGKIAGVRDLLQAEKFQKNAVELQLTAQSQTAVRGRSNSNSYTMDFIPTSLTSIGGGSTRSKRHHR